MMHVCLATSYNMYLQISVHRQGQIPLRGRYKYKGGSLDLEAQPRAPELSYILHGVYILYNQNYK